MQSGCSQRRSVIMGIWLIGLGVLFATGFWWPGILFVVALSSLAKGWLEDRFWVGVAAGFWLAFLGVWVLSRYSLAFLLVGLGASAILGGLTRPISFSKPKPFVDSTFE